MDRTTDTATDAMRLHLTSTFVSSAAEDAGRCRERARRTWGLVHAGLLTALLFLSGLLSGCGSGGYAGGGIAGVSASVVTIDATQSLTVSANVAGNLPVSWTLGGSACAAGCGTLSSATGTQTTYTAPATVSTPFQVTLQAQINGTTSARTITINVNPAPLILGTPPSGVVGTPYSFTFTTSGGTSPKKLTLLSGSLPAGLTFNATTGVVSGTPTTAGTSTFTLQLVDGSDVPFTVTASKSITINATAPTPTVTVTGNPPAGTVGTAYTTSLSATGGTSPYAWSVLSGSLPTGLTLNASTGVISGTATASGTFTFTAQAKDAAGVTGTASFTVVVGSGTTGTGVTISTGTLPNGTVGIAYTSSVGVTGGTSPYTCAATNGTLPAGLTLNANCTVTGTPTAAGTSVVTVRATDSGNPAQSGTGAITLTINPATLTLAAGTLPDGTVGTIYSATLGVMGGAAPYTCAVASGTVPAGLTLNANCTMTGTPTTAGTTAVMVRVTDSGSPTQTITSTQAITIGNAPTLTLTPPAAATVNTPYSGTVGVTGGTSPYTCAVTGGALPAGLVLNANCTLTGTPTAAGTSTVTVKATDSGSPAITGTSTFNVTVNPAGLGLASGTLPNGTVNTPYTGTVPVTGGTSPYSCMLTAGAVPAGLTLNTNCTVTGTPTTAGTTTAQVTVTDSSSPAKTESGPITLTINPAAVTLTTGTLPAGTVNTPYTATIGIAGGTSPYTCAITSGTLPAGLALNANCTVTGTPTTAGTSTVTVRATDAANPAQTGSGPVSVIINPATLTVPGGTLPSCTVGVTCTSTVPVTGGSSPYTCAVTSGTLPAGLTMGANCTITGTPTTPGTSTVTISVTDSGNSSQTGSGTYTITINPAALGLASGTLPNGTVGVTYMSTIGVTGGTSPYTCQLVSGTLPAGLALAANCTVSGTPTTPGTSTATVSVTDSGNPAQTGSGNVSITINPAPVTLTSGSLPTGTVNTPYTASIAVSGGTSPYTCSLVSGTLQAGLALNANCTVTGTPTASGTVTLQVKATDAASPAQNGTGTVSLTINPATLALSTGTLPDGTVGTPYSATVGVTGGTSPYTCSVVNGTLPTGLALNANCTVTGTPTMAGTSSVSVKVTDSGSPAQTVTGPQTITVSPAAATLTIGNPPAATVNTPYTGTIPVTGGTAPYSCTITSGTLPAGLTLGANCALSGTPTTAGSATVTVSATDSSSPAKTGSGPATITVQPVPTLTFTGSLPNGVVNQVYSQTLQASGGVGPYTYAVTSGALPAGITLSSSGVVSGTPTVVGASAFTVTATDSEGTPQTASLPLTLLITYGSNNNTGLLKGQYAFLFQGYDDVALGVLAYQTATAGSINADGNGAIIAGEQDSNGQGSNPIGTTVATRNLLGTYTIGNDRRGSLTLTSFNTDGSVFRTQTYAISLRAPVSPATSSAQGSFIQFDNANLAGTRGSGTLLQQSGTAIAAGLTGSYAFGMQGDTPCLPSCTIGIAAGPVASVGQFTATGGSITGGTEDANIGAVNYPSAALSGSYTAADTNGRVQLTLNNAALPAGIFPTDYAAYVVDANRVLLVSRDKHFSYILQAGTATLQTQSTFSTAASLNGPFVGYENAPVNPGLVSVALQQVLNLQTATIFRTTSNGSGTCTTTNVDSAGLTGIVNSLGGLINAPVVSALIGTYQERGNSSCTAAANGRAVLNYPPPGTALTTTLTLLGLPVVAPSPRVLYLTAPNQGYFLETSYAGLGMIEAQSGSPYNNTGLNGTYVYNSIPASSLATLNSSGVFTADGAGNDSFLVDKNVGVGNINVLQLGVASNGTYAIQDTTAGRFQLSTNEVVYEIVPGRFVLLEPPVLNLNPYVALLY